VAAAVVVVVIGVAIAFVLLHTPGNVSHPNLSFTVPTTTTTTTTTTAKKRPVNNFLWPRYGLDAARTRAFQGPSYLHPPFHVGWTHDDYALLEFPPVIDGATMYWMNDSGYVKALNTANGRILWSRRVGTLAAASPAIGVRQGSIYVPVLSTNGSSPGNGRIVALSMRNGSIRWSRPLAAGSESSPMVWKSSLYFGDQGGSVYSMNAATGHLNWVYHASGSVKGGPAYQNGRLYFGDYDGRAYCLNAATGHQIWAVSTSGASFGFGSGNFYSTPAVAFGRVYMGNTDGRVYSFAAGSGALAWATATGAYVYASAAVADVPGLGPTVYLGSYDGDFYAFDARSGAIRWRHPAGGKISGSSTIVNGVVYYANLGTKTAAGLDVHTGRQVASFKDGAFTPVIADDHALYLVGQQIIYQMLPSRAATTRKSGPARHAARHPAKHGAKHHSKHAAKRSKTPARRRK
jgi:outer membrane protein assembly factor BamB